MNRADVLSRMAAMSPDGGAMSRRTLVKLAGATLGAGAAMSVLTAWGQMPIPGQTAPPALSGNGKGTKVVVIGAGPGGCPAAWELVKAGYDVTVIEARDRLGGHAFTVRGGSKTMEFGKGEQECTWDDPDMWYDAGPSRIPFYHRGFFHYAQEFNIPLITHQNLNLNGYVYAEGIGGSLDKTKMRLHEMQADMAGYTSELLAKAVNQGALDKQVTAEDRELLLQYLVNWGILSDSDFKYEPDDHRGYSVLPDAFSSGEIGDPFPFSDLVPFAASTLGMSGGYLAATAVFDWQTTLVKPKDGMSQLYEVGFKKALGDRVHLNSEVTEIRQNESGVRVVYKDKTTGETKEATGDYCLCNMPLSVLIKITADFSDEMQTAIRSVPYAMASRTGLGFNRRFWEEDDWIYGGQSFSNIPELGIIDYPDSEYTHKKGALLCGYNFGTNAARVSSLSFDDRVNLMLDYGSRIHPQMKDEFQSGFSVAWHLEPYSLGAWPSYTPKNRAEAFPILQEPDGRIYLVGEHLSYVNAWIEGAVQAAWMQVEKLDKRVAAGG